MPKLNNKIWFELDPKKLGNKSIIYGQHYIETYYIKKNNNYVFKYGVSDNNKNLLIEYNNFQDCIYLVDKLMHNKQQKQQRKKQ
jgi:hypothetical protein